MRSSPFSAFPARAARLRRARFRLPRWRRRPRPPRRRPRRTTRSPPTSASSASTSSAASRRPTASPRCRAASTGRTRAASTSAPGRRTSAGSRTSAPYTRSSLEWDFYGGYKGNFPAATTGATTSAPSTTATRAARNPGFVNANTCGALRRARLEMARREGYSYSLDNYFGAATRRGQKTDGTWYIDFNANYPVGESGFTLLGHFGILDVTHDGSGNTQGLATTTGRSALRTRCPTVSKGVEVGAYYTGNNAEEGVLHRPHRQQHRRRTSRRLRQEDVLTRGAAIRPPTAYARTP